MNDFKIKIFILTLKQNNLRRKKLLDQLDEMYLPYQLWFGIDGTKKLPLKHENKINRKKAKKKFYRDLTDAEFACSLSHNEIYHEIVKQDLHGAVILEDDAVLSEGFKELFLSFSFNTIDLLLLDHQNAYVSLKQKYKIIMYFIGYKVFYPPFLTTGYYLSLSAANQMIKKSAIISGVADWPCDITTMNCAAIMPRAVQQRKDAKISSLIKNKRDKMIQRNRYRRFFKIFYWKKKYAKVIHTRLV